MGSRNKSLNIIHICHNASLNRLFNLYLNYGLFLHHFQKVCPLLSIWSLLLLIVVVTLIKFLIGSFQFAGKVCHGLLRLCCIDFHVLYFFIHCTTLLHFCLITGLPLRLLKRFYHIFVYFSIVFLRKIWYTCDRHIISSDDRSFCRIKACGKSGLKQAGLNDSIFLPPQNSQDSSILIRSDQQPLIFVENRTKHMNDILDLHTHTIASGHAYNTLYEMARSASEKGVGLLGVTDHAPRIPGACHPFHFINFKVVPRTLFGVRLLLGCELNIIDYSGNIDLEPRYQKGLDFAIASIHEPCYACGTIAENTAAYLGAMKNPGADYWASG